MNNSLMTSYMVKLIKARLDNYFNQVCSIKANGTYFEYGNIYINLGRQAGHTSAISELYRPCDFYITVNELGVKEFVKKVFPFESNPSRFNKRIMSISTLATHYHNDFISYRGHPKLDKVPVIYVDCYSMLSKKQVDNYISRLLEIIYPYTLTESPVVYLG